ncbi:hypothetical protein BIY21_12285 [Vibrio ponticus]|uniref:HTH araC/xylS-type domain-containing protein n=1 Tax=Vibrio ponticus TaxID=265668 RepID=A0ABX3FHI1_9VIBR|nr:response regulator transcription factor [Vibrio ponticus]OLQ92232.1 hypothetical protein BIY21_12285 [Vibrio ponticus]
MIFHKLNFDIINLEQFHSKRAYIARICDAAGTITINGLEVNNLKDTLIFIPQNATVQCHISKQEHKGQLELISLNVKDKEKLKTKLLKVDGSLLSRKKKQTLVVSENDEIREIFLLTSAIQTTPFDLQTKVLALKHHVFSLLLTLHIYGHDISVLFQQPQHLTTSERLAKLIMDAPRENWTLAYAAKRLFTSSSTLRRNLAREGNSFSTILTDVRLGIALNQLTFTNHTIFKVGELSGFNSAPYFCTSFKKKFAMTPQEFRTQSKSSNTSLTARTLRHPVAVA